jgi:hypothetical protein
MNYLVIERFTHGPAPIYQRLAERGRMMPDGLAYVSSWITDDLTTCYQVMETDDPALLKQWTSNWDDLMEFDIMPVLTSAQVRARFEQAGRER